MRPLSLSLIVLHGVVWCLSSSKAADFSQVRRIAAEGVIIPAAEAKRQGIATRTISGFWTPTDSDVQALERRLPKFLLAEAARDRGLRRQITEVRSRLRQYRRQYVGAMVEGRRVILLNAFPRNEDFHWRREFVEVSDGGTSFWDVLYDVGRRSFLDLAIHGVAWQRDPSNQAMQLTASKPADRASGVRPSNPHASIHAQRARGS